jgi:hypothetical protein
VIAVGYTSVTLQMALGRLGWSHFTTQSTSLPSNSVYDVIAGPDGRMVLGTEHGAVIWSPPVATDLPDDWTVFTTENSGLPHNRVLSVARDKAGHLWFGTQAGLGRYDGAVWQTYGADDLGLTAPAQAQRFLRVKRGQPLPPQRPGWRTTVFSPWRLNPGPKATGCGSASGQGPVA